MAGSAKVHGLLHKFKDLDKSYALNSPTPTERGELAVLQQINGYIAKIGSPITVVAGKHTFKDIYGANKVEGTPKADIALVTYDAKKKKFVDVCFISHKMGKDARGFQQYSGTTTKADGIKAGSISKDKTLLAFLRTLTGFHNSIVDGRERFYRTIKDKTLIGKAVYGPQFGETKYGIDNIHLIGQGDVSFTAKAGKHHMKFSAPVSYNPDVKEFMHGGYTSIIGARYSGGRNYESDGKTYKGVRVLIMPKELIGTKAKEI
jgi:hypothetical protein